MPTVLSYIPIVSSGAVLGLGVGFAAKKIGKYLVIVAGAYFATLLTLQYLGWITINRSLGGTVNSIVDFLTQRIGTAWAAATVALPVVGAFAAGLFLGIRRF
jgi:uncharacterized membrane protein (Fun14 family)